MGLFDELATTNPQQVQQHKPARGRFVKEGYLDWENPIHATPDATNRQIREVVGVILPPYATFLQERIAAAKAGTPFAMPFYLNIGHHSMGGRMDKEKVFYHCQRDLIRLNKVNTSYPMLPAEVSSLPDVCPVCESCWDVAWPKCKEFEHNKNTPEYKTYKEAHKQLCPQQKMVFNFLPMGSNEPVLLEAPKTLGESICNLHYDPKQPDLLWPCPIGQFSCCWLQIRRTDMPDTTKYEVFPVYHNIPHVRNAANAFDEATYLSIIAKMKDLRQVAKTYLPTAEETAKAIAKRDKILSMHSLVVHTQVQQQVAQATAGVPGSLASPAPTMPLPPPVTPVQPTAVPPPPIAQTLPAPTRTLPPAPAPVSPAGPPPIASPAAAPAGPAVIPPSAMTLPANLPPAQPPAPAASKEADGAFDMLQGLLNNNQ